jgi:hypothetical protein
LYSNKGNKLQKKRTYHDLNRVSLKDTLIIKNKIEKNKALKQGETYAGLFVF